MILSSELLKRAFEESGQGLVVTDLEGHILSVSEKITQITGYTEMELVGLTPAAFKSGQTPEATYKDLWQTIRNGQTWKTAILNKRKDGTVFLDRETIFRGKNPGGNGACFIAIHRNSVVELDLRMQVTRADGRLQQTQHEIEDAKTKIESLVAMTAQQAEAASHALTAALEARNPYTAGHGRRTALLMDLIGTELGLFEGVSQNAIRVGAILHDLGKIGVPDGVLLKQGRLTEAEFEAIKAHPSIGFDILSMVVKQEETLRVVRHHHEKLDGSGYPDGLHGFELPDYVKAFAVCDQFDAMTSARAYRPAMSGEDAISILTDDALSGLLDMSAVKTLKRLWRSGILSDALELRQAA